MSPFFSCRNNGSPSISLVTYKHMTIILSCIALCKFPHCTLAYLWIVIHKVLEVIFGFEDPFGDEVIKVDTDSGCERGSISVCQPRHLGRVLVVGVREAELGLKTMDNTSRGVPVVITIIITSHSCTCTLRTFSKDNPNSKKDHLQVYSVHVQPI